jgi:hypothetical protein
VWPIADFVTSAEIGAPEFDEVGIAKYPRIAKRA